MDDPLPSNLTEEMTKFLATDSLRPVGQDIYEEVFDNNTLFPLQRQQETAAMIREARRVNPKVLYEIGTDKGGSLYHWCKSLPSLKRVIACEIRGVPYAEVFAKAFPHIDFLWLAESSYDAITVRTVEKWLNNDRIDCLFIDGDKSMFELDFDRYLPLMDSHGVVFMHDVQDSAPVEAYNKVCKRGYYHHEIINTQDSTEAMQRRHLKIPPKNAHEGWLRYWRGRSCGVGVIRLGSKLLLEAAPSLSVVICSYNDAPALLAQLHAIAPQLDVIDELVLLDDGSTDSTQEVFKEFSDTPRYFSVKYLRNTEPSGVNQAYNQAVQHATKEWIYLPSANDLVQPGVFDAFRQATKIHPSASLVCGIQKPSLPILWGNETKYLSPQEVKDAWTGIVQIVGACSFVRRNIRPLLDVELAWNADWFLLQTLALNHGLIWMPHIVARIGPTGFDCNGERQDQLKPVREAILQRVLADEFLAPIFQEKPLVMQWLETGRH